MKQLNIKISMVKIIILCLFTFSSSLNYGQVRTVNSKALVKTNTNVIDFQKEYIKHLNIQLKCNNEMLRFIEKELRRNTFQKEYTVKLNAQLKRDKESLNNVKNDIDKMDKTLNSVDNDNQLDDIDLQNMLQKQQQIIQMLSSVSKALNDTALSIIRKIG